MPSPVSSYSRDCVANAIVAYLGTINAYLFDGTIGASLDVDAGFAYNAAPFDSGEAVGTGYAGVALAAVAAESQGGGVVAFTATSPTWTITGSFTADVEGMLLARDSDDEGFAWLSFGGAYNVTDGVFTGVLDDAPTGVTETFYTQS